MIQPSNHGHQLVSGETWVQVAVPIMNHCVKRLMIVKSVVVKIPHVGEVLKVRECRATSGVFCIIVPGLKTTRSVANSPRVALECDVSQKPDQLYRWAISH
ncbi:hypothetical protein TNCV_4780771 [Trichonephila clavipes]|nr:hypothetical protein TNCV_4780771 [Trichonephila clavipes]